MIPEIARLSGEVAELRRRLSQIHRRGRVHEVRRGDNGRQVRVRLGQDAEGSPLLTPWLPWPGANGALKIDTVPAVGEHVFIDCSDGSWENAEVRPSNFHQEGEAPSEGNDDNVITYGGWRVEFTPDQIKVTKGGTEFSLAESGLTVKVGDVEHKITDEGLRTIGGLIRHGASEGSLRNIGRTHRHENVAPGGGLSGIPITG